MLKKIVLKHSKQFGIKKSEILNLLKKNDKHDQKSELGPKSKAPVIILGNLKN